MDRSACKGCVGRLGLLPNRAVQQRAGDRSPGYLVEGFSDVNVFFERCEGFFDRGKGAAHLLDHRLSKATGRLKDRLGCVKDGIRHVGNRTRDGPCGGTDWFEHGLGDRFDRLDDRGHDGLNRQARRLDGRSGDGLSSLADCLDHAGRGRLGRFCCRFQQRLDGLGGRRFCHLGDGRDRPAGSVRFIVSGLSRGDTQQSESEGCTGDEQGAAQEAVSLLQ
ncbi:hypothetical protein [Arthrobacter mangrovi]|uniref:Uncharacterized protein n=1 Tax=Arthrobacter mangrovi TaxID=2966350 RepID=A0ABQ5MP09_9MICC|nr:hypothetical protein [Arthrobacter mangrovi]GLB65721.1 hypothetical protein AHIS1636_01600 [Arthrobacter mangrovi]